MKKPLKAIVAVALAFTAAGFVATSGSAKADIIDVPRCRQINSAS